MSLRPPTRGEVHLVGLPAGHALGSTPRSRTVRATLRRRTATSPGAARPWRGSVELLWQGRSVTLRRGPKGSTPLAALRRCIPARRSWCPASPGTTRGDPHRRAPGGIPSAPPSWARGAAIDGAPALEARIAALASSGEEDVSYSQVERRLRDWLNRRKHNKTGLIPGWRRSWPTWRRPLARQSKAFRLAQEARRELERLQAEHRLLESGAGRPPQPGHGPAQGPVGGGPGRPCRGPGPGGRPGGRAYPPRRASPTRIP